MNKDKCQGFVTGVLISALALGLGGAALAAGRTIQVDDGIAVTINGVPFTPRDANGQEVPLFAYNGTTYAPVRAFSRAAGLAVDYDAATRTARVETADYASLSDPAAASYIGADRARELALADAGVSADDARILKACLDWEDGRAVYGVAFCALRAEYDYELDAVTGAILSRESELPDFDWACHDDYRIDHGLGAGQSHHGGDHHSGDHHSGQPDWAGSDGSGTNPAGLIPRARAMEIALEQAPGAQVVKCELDRDDGRYRYEVELRLDGVEYECDIDAATGAILSWDEDHD